MKDDKSQDDERFIFKDTLIRQVYGILTTPCDKKCMISKLNIICKGEGMTEDEELMIYEDLCLQFDRHDLWKFFAKCLVDSLVEVTKYGDVLDEREVKFIDDVLIAVKKSWEKRTH